MPINPDNDEVVVFKDSAGEWRWHRVDLSNGKVVLAGTEGYVDQDYTVEAAKTYNPGVPVRIEE